jgi:hypothetical protein
VTRVILWKEMREQAHVAITLVAFAIGVIAATAVLSTAHDAVAIVSALAIFFAWILGVLTGAQLLATEKENGTQVWLDSLPTSRRDLWWRKVGAGGALVGAQIFTLWLLFLLVQHFVFGAAVFAQLGESRWWLLLGLMAIPSVCGYWCGLFGSAIGRTPLGAVGWAILAQWAIIGPVALCELLRVNGILSLWFCVALTIGPFVLAGWRYARLDRLRHHSVRVLTACGPATRRVVLWLAWRQGGGIYWVLVLTAVGLAVIVPLTTPLVWPIVGALFGVVAGLMVFGPDQNGSAYRMFGDRRLPLGGIWRGKLGLPMAVVCVGIVLLTSNLFARYVVDVANPTNATDGTRRNLVWLRSGLSFATLVLGPLYGFACGQFFGLFYRKAAVAAVLAIVTSLAAVLFWLPSITLGGLHLRQWLAPPVVLLVATRAAMRPWVTARLGNWRAVTGLVFACVGAVLALAAGVAYRMVELPAPAAPFDSRAFARDLMAEQTEGGRRVRQAIAEFAAHLQQVEAKLLPPAVEGGGAPGMLPPAGAPAVAPGSLVPPGPPPGIVRPGGGDVGPVAPPLIAPQGPPLEWDTMALDALENGWPVWDHELRRWLDELAQGEWWATLHSADGLPAGASLDPHGLDTATVESARRMGLLLAARSLQLQKQGDADGALQPLEMALTLTANLQTLPNGHQLSVALVVERQALDVLGEWTKGVGARPQLLRRALAVVLENDLARAPLLRAVDVEFARALRAAPPWRFDNARNDIEGTLVQFAGAIPWEVERYRRFVEAVREGYVRYAALDFRTAAAAFGGRPRQYDANLGQAFLWRWVGRNGTSAQNDETGQSLIEFINRSPWLKDEPIVFVPELSQWYNVQTHLQGSVIRLALMLYQCDHGRLPDSLEALAPDYLQVVPMDPYSSAPFRYRISSGERIFISPRARVASKIFRDLAPGTAIVWSVGPDLNDGGGKSQEPHANYAPGLEGSDALFIVPRISKP